MTIVVVSAVVVAGWSAMSVSAAPTRDAVVQPGDTVLTLVLREMPDIDPIRAAELFEAANGPSSAHVVPGMTVTIPTGR